MGGEGKKSEIQYFLFFLFPGSGVFLLKMSPQGKKNITLVPGQERNFTESSAVLTDNRVPGAHSSCQPHPLAPPICEQLVGSSHHGQPWPWGHTSHGRCRAPPLSGDPGRSAATGGHRTPPAGGKWGEGLRQTQPQHWSPINCSKTGVKNIQTQPRGRIGQSQT